MCLLLQKFKVGGEDVLLDEAFRYPVGHRDLMEYGLPFSDLVEDGMSSQLELLISLVGCESVVDHYGQVGHLVQEEHHVLVHQHLVGLERKHLGVELVGRFARDQIDEVGEAKPPQDR